MYAITRDGYPESSEVDAWIEGLLEEAAQEPFEVEPVLPSGAGWPRLSGLPETYAARHHPEPSYLRFAPRRRRPFYCLWQPSFSRPSRIVVHLPGYGAEMSAHPELVSAGYSVLHVNPLGHCSDAGFDFSQSENPREWKGWPQLPLTVASYGEKGYRDWLVNSIQAVGWIRKWPGALPGGVSFIGTSQGGGGALLLASILRDEGVRCVAADLPFLTDFRLAAGRGAYALAQAALEKVGDAPRAWRALGFFDTVSHAHRLTLPVLLTAGGRDETCPPDTILSLDRMLPGIHSCTYLAESGHGYTPEFLFLAEAWLRMYA